MLIPPYEQFLAQYTVTTPATGFSQNFINLVVPNPAVGAVTLDGTAIPASQFVAIGSDGFSGTQRAVALGAHNLAGPLPFGTFMYGFASFNSYGYPGGMSLSEVARVTSVALAPKTATNPVNTQHCVTATVRDQSDAPLPDIRGRLRRHRGQPHRRLRFLQYLRPGPVLLHRGQRRLELGSGPLSAPCPTPASEDLAVASPPGADHHHHLQRRLRARPPARRRVPCRARQLGHQLLVARLPHRHASATKSLSLNGNKVPAPTEGSFAFVTPRRLLRLEAFNGGPAPAVVTLRCDGALARAGHRRPRCPGHHRDRLGRPLRQRHPGRRQRLEDQLRQPGGGRHAPPGHAAPGGPQRPLGAATGPSTGQAPAPDGLVDWGTGQWFLSGPKGAFSTKSVSLANGLNPGQARPSPRPSAWSACRPTTAGRPRRR